MRHASIPVPKRIEDLFTSLQKGYKWVLTARIPIRFRLYFQRVHSDTDRTEQCVEEQN